MLTLCVLRAAYTALLGIGVRQMWTAPGWLPAGPGLGVLAAGILLRNRALDAIGDCYSGTRMLYRGHRVVENGPYRHLRHPLAMGMLLEFTGLAIISPGFPALAVAALGAAALLVNNVREETLLAEHFGEAYRAMCRRTWDLTDCIPVRAALDSTTGLFGRRRAHSSPTHLLPARQQASPLDHRPRA
jgi:protein-S-isoprenylcysteine O-methyltransferase Ste14